MTRFVVGHECTWIMQFNNLDGWYKIQLSMTSLFPFLFSMENSGRMTNHLHVIKKRFPDCTCQETVGGRWKVRFSVFCGLWMRWIQCIHIFFVFRTLYLFCTLLHPDVSCFMLPNPRRLPSTDLSFLPQDPRRSARPWGRTARLPITNGRSEPSTLQESGLTWKLWAQIDSAALEQVELLYHCSLPQFIFSPAN